MIRRQLPVHSPVSVGGLLRASRTVVAGSAADTQRLATTLRAQLSAAEVALTDSGTSALVLALRLAAGSGGAVAMPAYSCVDLAAAAIRAGIRVRLYDLDPRTLSPDLDDLERTIERGVDAIVVAHLYGYPADMRELGRIAARAGVPLIEDAAQAAGGTLHGRPIGTFGDLVVLSFGRGKGLTGGNGGALLAGGERWGALLQNSAQRLGKAERGLRNVALASAQWLLGRPALYWLPSGIPWLRLGEMVYHPAGEPRPLPEASATLVLDALRLAGEELVFRRRNGSLIADMVGESASLLVTRAVEGAEPGYLRLPVLNYANRAPSPEAGILRGYPGTLADQEVLAEALCTGERAGPGAVELGTRAFTIPTHGMVSRRDLERIREWIAQPAAINPMPALASSGGSGSR